VLLDAKFVIILTEKKVYSVHKDFLFMIVFVAPNVLQIYRKV